MFRRKNKQLTTVTEIAEKQHNKNTEIIPNKMGSVLIQIMFYIYIYTCMMYISLIRPHLVYVRSLLR